VQSYGLEVISADSGSNDVVQAGGSLVVLSGGSVGHETVMSATVISSGGVASVTKLLGGREDVDAGGTASGTTVSRGGAAYVFSRGAAESATVSSGGKVTIFSGGVASGLALLSGGQLSDDGAVTIAGAGALDGILLGSGTITETGGGDLVLSGDGGKFAGTALGSGSVTFVEPTTGSAVLQIDAADAPKAGGTFANVISNFSGTNEDIDLRSIAYVTGATATVVGSTLVLVDGAATYAFDVAGITAGAYPVVSDGHGGTLIDPKALAFAHAAAAFAPSDAANAALASSTSPSDRTPLLHAVASAGHL
jgi:fibronectin-binding autotransporter adhesin